MTRRGRARATCPPHSGTTTPPTGQIRCHAPAELSAQRLRNRARSASDADQRVAEAMAADQDAWPDAHDLPTDGPEEDTIARAATLIGVDRDPGCRRESTRRPAARA